MASPEDYAAWIVANKDKQGTPEFDTVAKAYQLSRQGAKPTAQPEPDYNPTSGMTGTEKFLAGAGKGMTDLVRGVGQAAREGIDAVTPTTLSTLITGKTNPVADFLGLPSAKDADAVKARDRALMDTGAGLAGNITGTAATLLPTAFIPGAGTYAGAAAIGAGQGVLAPVASDESRLQNAAMGGVGGAGGVLAARALSRAVQPIAQSEGVKKLLSEGVVPTPGQAAGGWVGRVENSLESLPLVGQIIKNAKTRGVEELNAAALKRSVPSGTQQEITAVGRRGLEQADDILSRGYERVVPNISVKATNDFRRSITEAGFKDSRFLTEQGEKELSRVLESRVFNRIPETGEIPGRLVQRMDSELGQIARDYSKSTDAAQRAFAGAVRDIQTELRTYIASQAKGTAAEELRDLNKAFANLVRVERASGYTGAKEGVFSAAQLQQAVRATDSGGRSFARGNALMQDLSDPAKAVLQDTVPDSGTAGRLLTAAGITGAGVDAIFGNPGYLTALAASPVLYSRAGARYMVGDLPGQAAAAQFLRSTSPYSSVLGMGISGRAGK